MGKCPERPSPSPPAVVGTFPYNLLNGTAGKPLYGDSITVSPVSRRHDHGWARESSRSWPRRVSVSTSPRHPRRCAGPAIRDVDLPEDGDSPRHHLE